MKTFMEWLSESSQDAKARLETAAREYMATNPPPEQCYYVPHYDVNTDSPEEMERLVGSGYDRSTKVVRGDHPTAFRCIGVAHGLAKFLNEKGFRARVVAGWYGKAGRGSHSDQIRLDSPSAPEGFKGERPRQHWWVEADGFYVDLTSAQFHPLSPRDQRDLVIRDKSTAFDDGEYAPVRRLPLGRRAKLPDAIVRMVDKIVSLKKFANGRSGSWQDREELQNWIRKNSARYGLEPRRMDDLFLSMQGHDFHFADRVSMVKMFGEVFDDMEEDDAPKDATPFKPPEPKRSRGTVRRSRASVTLSSTSPDQMDDNFAALVAILNRHFPGMKVGEPHKGSYRGRHGEVFEFTANFSDMDDSWLSMFKWGSNYDERHKAFFKDLKREGFSEPR